MTTIIRKATEKDLQALLDIYNYEVTHGVATLDLKPKTLAEWQIWFSQHNTDSNRHPLYVAEADGQIAGYASLSSYREKEAFQSTAELSVYIHPNYRNQGIATTLMAFILEDARKSGLVHTVVSVITSGNEASRKLHEKFHFTFCGTIQEVGVKFGSYQDIDNYQLTFSDGQTA